MQRLSYDQRNPIYDIFGEKFSLEIFTLENVYGIDPERTDLKVEGDRAILTARGLTWAGGRETCEGGAMFLVEKSANGLTFKLEAAHRDRLRAAKVIVKGQRGTSVTSDHSENYADHAGRHDVRLPALEYFHAPDAHRFPQGGQGVCLFFVSRRRGNAEAFFLHPGGRHGGRGADLRGAGDPVCLSDCHRSLGDVHT